MKIKIINRSANRLPAYETIHSAGMDLRAFLNESIVIEPMKRALIPTGIYLEIPEGFEAQIRPRSGLAFRNGITVLNSPGTIDADYRGEVKVVLINLGEEKFEVKNGDRIAQMIIAKHEKAEWEEAKSLSDTSRGAGGYGSTGN
ncbi:MAG: dUTP diphosphatase [Bacteroidia bacterium]